ncbi:MAG: hypothetical protein J6J00_08095 [Treponema sp.]|nr:hypothetical protein [Treponema sp.]
MPGIIVEIAKDKLLGNFGNSRMSGLISGVLSDNKTYSVERHTISKFLNDKAFYEDDKYLVVTEGVILNSLHLQKMYLGTTDSSDRKLAQTIIEMYKKKGEKFFNDFRGSFSGVFFDKNEGVWLIYTNHIGNKQIFYTQTDNGFAIASEITWLTDYRKKNRMGYTLDIQGAYYLLTYAFMLEDHTLFNEIKKLTAGKYIRIQNENMTIETFFALDNTPSKNEKEDEIIENLDLLFRNAIKLEFDKDLEYGYKHFASLSGGLDSRMDVLVAHQMGYKKQVNWTIGQSDCLDETIAKKIASDFKHDWFFKSLDNGNYLINLIDDMVDLQFGMVLACGSSHCRSFMQNFNFKEYGLSHTGQLGDAILGTYLPGRKENSDYIGEGAYSTKLLNRLSTFSINEKYDNSELFKFYNRGFSGILQGDVIDQEYTEVASPFLDVDFMNYSLHIPASYRKGEQIYMKWIIKKYPDIAKYKWQKINAKITDKWINILGRRILVKRIPLILIRKLFPFINKNGKKNLSKNKVNMNPFDYWYLTNPDLREYMDSYYKNTILLVPEKYHMLKADMEKLYEGSVIDKELVLTLLGSIKKYFADYSA